MNGFDIAILVTLLGFLIKGLLRGLLKEACSLVGLFLGAFLAFRYHGPLADALLSRVDLPVPIALGITFSTLFLVTMILFLALGFLLSKFVKLLFLGGFNRLLGGLFGLVQATLLLAMVMFALSLRPLPWGWDKTLKQSQLAPPFSDLGKTALEGSRQIFKCAGLSTKPALSWRVRASHSLNFPPSLKLLPVGPKLPTDGNVLLT